MKKVVILLNRETVGETTLANNIPEFPNLQDSFRRSFQKTLRESGGLPEGATVHSTMTPETMVVLCPDNANSKTILQGIASHCWVGHAFFSEQKAGSEEEDRKRRVDTTMWIDDVL